MNEIKLTQARKDRVIQKKHKIQAERGGKNKK